MYLGAVVDAALLVGAAQSWGRAPVHGLPDDHVESGRCQPPPMLLAGLIRRLQNARHPLTWKHSTGLYIGLYM